MANLNDAELKIEWDWQSETYKVTGKVRFLFGATRYTLKIDQQVIMPTQYANVADQVEHVFIDVAARLGKLNNAQMTLEADEEVPYL